MQTLAICCALVVMLASLLPLPAHLKADQTKDLPDQRALQASQDASLAWLQLLDRGEYKQSWEKASKIMQGTIAKDGWETVLSKMRKPLGNVISREVLDQRTAKDPSGLPKGDYIVMFYKTDFSNKASAHELVTLYLENGKWHVLTYQVD